MDEPDRSRAELHGRDRLWGCPECGSRLVHAQGCLSCGSCGYSRCG